MKIVDGNILDVTEGFIVHQVNCKGVMGSGVAGAIRGKYPEVYAAYTDFCDGIKPELLLGHIQLVDITDDLTVVNLFGQFGYGGNGLYTEYGAVRSGFAKLYNTQVRRGGHIYVPYLMGCALGGGNWNIYSQIIEEEVGDFTAIRLR